MDECILHTYCCVFVCTAHVMFTRMHRHTTCKFIERGEFFKKNCSSGRSYETRLYYSSIHPIHLLNCTLFRGGRYFICAASSPTLLYIYLLHCVHIMVLPPNQISSHKQHLPVFALRSVHGFVLTLIIIW